MSPEKCDNFSEWTLIFVLAFYSIRSIFFLQEKKKASSKADRKAQSVHEWC